MDGAEQVRVVATQFARAQTLAEKEAEWWGARAGTYGRNDQFRERSLIGKLGEVAVEQWAQQYGVDAFPLFAWPTFASKADLVLNPSRSPFRDRRFNRYLSEEEARRHDALEAENAATDAARRAKIERRRAEDRKRYGPLTRPKVLPPGGPSSPDASGSPGLPGGEPGPLWAGGPPPARTEPPVDLTIEVKTWTATSFDQYGFSINADQLPRITKKAGVVVWTRVTKRSANGAVIEFAGWNTPEEIAAAADARWRPGLVAQWQLDPSIPHPLVSPRDLTAKYPVARRDGRRCPHQRPESQCFACLLPDPDEPPRVLVSAGDARFFHAGSEREVIAAHGNWAFTAETWTEPVTAVIHEKPACPWCFPRSIHSTAM